MNGEFCCGIGGFFFVFVIAANCGTGPDWRQVGSTSATKFLHDTQAPGVAVVYRVSACRAGQTSAPSAEVGLYIKPAEAKLSRAA